MVCHDSASKKKRRVRKTSKRFVLNEERNLAECRGKKQIVCLSDPNCSYRRRVGCVKRRRKSGEEEELFFGPILPNIASDSAKSTRKSRKAVKKSGRKSRKVVKKSGRKSRKSVKKSGRKSRKSRKAVKKSGRKSRKAVKKSGRKSRKAVKKSGRK